MQFEEGVLFYLPVSTGSFTWSKRQWGVGKYAAFGLMLALWLGTTALSASPQLHHWFHQDAGKPNHSCVLTQLGREIAIIHTGAIVCCPPPTVLFAEVCEFARPCVPGPDFRLSPSRAPPAGFFASLA